MNSRWVWKYRALTGLKNCGVTNGSSHHSRGSIWGGPRFSSPVVLVTSGRDSESAGLSPTDGSVASRRAHRSSIRTCSQHWARFLWQHQWSNTSRCERPAHVSPEWVDNSVLMKACLDFLLFCLNKGMKGTAVKEEGAWIFIPKVKTAAWF